MWKVNSIYQIQIGGWKISTRDGKDELPWTLARYFAMRQVRYPSKTKFVCVQKLPMEEGEHIILTVYVQCHIILYVCMYMYILYS